MSGFTMDSLRENLEAFKRRISISLEILDRLFSEEAKSKRPLAYIMLDCLLDPYALSTLWGES